MPKFFGAKLLGKTALVTGGSDGIGLQVATNLAAKGAVVIIVSRNESKGEAAVDLIRSVTSNPRVSFTQCDLSLIEEIDRFVERFFITHSSLDILVHCAGLVLPTRTLTREGLETIFAVQYIARFHLSNSLVNAISRAKGVIVSISAAGASRHTLDFKNLYGEKRYSGVTMLSQEAVANEVFGLRFIAKHPEITFYSYEPYFVKTKFFDSMSFSFKMVNSLLGFLNAVSPEDAAGDIAELIASDYPSGIYGSNLRVVEANRSWSDTVLQDNLWIVSEHMVDLAKATYNASMWT